MVATPDLIDALSESLTPVRRLRPPLIRAGCWLVLAFFILGLLAICGGLRPDLAQHLRQPGFAIRLAAMLLTGILAAVAAFMLSLPDRSPLWLLLPTPALFGWLSTIGYQCLTNWVSFNPDGIGLGESAQCFAILALTSLPLSLAMVMMLRHAGPVRRTATSLTGSLAVAAITATALSLFHEFDATVMILIWNLGTAASLIGIGGLFGRRMLVWAAPRPLPPRG